MKNLRLIFGAVRHSTYVSKPLLDILLPVVTAAGFGIVIVVLVVASAFGKIVPTIVTAAMVFAVYGVGVFRGRVIGRVRTTSMGVAGPNITGGRIVYIPWADVESVVVVRDDYSFPYASGVMPVRGLAKGSMIDVSEWASPRPDEDTHIVENMNAVAVMDGKDNCIWARTSDQTVLDAILRAMAWHKAEFGG